MPDTAMDLLLAQLSAGVLNVQTILVWTVVAGFLSALGGLVTGVVMGGRELGHDLAALMGALFGPTAAVPAVFVVLVVFMLHGGGG